MIKIRQYQSTCIIVLIFLFVLSSSALFAQITLDGTLGPSGSLTGPDYAISSDMGQLKGGNLFHSFGLFNLSDRETATFTGPDHVSRIISRITGGNPSAIDGLIRSDIMGASLYLFNPAGLAFGPNASLDISGSFHTSTAAYLNFTDGGRFDAVTPEDSILTSAPVAAFGFLDAPEIISMDAATLNVPERESISVIGGDIRLTGTELTAPTGKISISSAAASGEIALSETGADLAPGQDGGAITLSDQSIVSGGDSGGEEIYIRGGDLVVKNGSSMVATSTTDNGEGEIDVQVQQSLELSDGGTLRLLTRGEKDGGQIKVDAGEITITGLEEITGIVSATGFDTTGRGGDIDIVNSGTLTMSHGGGIYSFTYGDGDTGNLSVQSNIIRADGEGAWAGVTAGVYIDARGNGGRVEVAADTMELTDGGVIDVSTSGIGDAGHLILTARDLTIDGKGNQNNTGLTARSELGATGRGGNISMAVEDRITILNNGVITVQTYGDGDAGDLSLEAGEILIDGQGTSSGIGAEVLLPDAGGQGGSITVEVKETIALLNGGKMSVTTFGQGDAGKLSADARNIYIDGMDNPMGTGFFAQVDSPASGRGGDLVVSAEDTLVLLNGGEVSATTFGDGDAGNIMVHAGTVWADQQDAIAWTGFSADVREGAPGNGGDIAMIVDNDLNLLNGAGIAVQTRGQGNAGSLSVTASDILINGQGKSSGIGAEVYPGATGHGGDIIVTATNSLELYNGAKFNASTFGQGNAGDLEVNAGRIWVDSMGNKDGTGFFSQVIAGSSGSGGDLNISVKDDLVLENGGEINVSTYSEGDAGSLTVSARNLIVNNKGNETGTGLSGQVHQDARGNGGDISIQVPGNIELINGGRIIVTTFGEGNAGNLETTAGDIYIENMGDPGGTGFFAQVGPESVGSGGDLDLMVLGGINILDGGLISVSTQGQGDAGNLNITTGQMTLDTTGGSWAGLSAGVDDGATGHGGDIVLNVVSDLNMIEGAGILVRTSGEGDGGSLFLNTADILVDGKGTDSGIGAEVDQDARGNGGDVTIENKGSMILLNGGQVSMSTLGEGSAGRLEIKTGDLILDGRNGTAGTGLFARVDTGALGDGGDIAIVAQDKMEIADGAVINTSTYGQGNAGNLDIECTNLHIDSRGNPDGTGIFAQVREGGDGRGGDLDIRVGQDLKLDNGGHINVSTFGNGSTGNLNVAAQNILIDGWSNPEGTGIYAQVDVAATGHGGDVTIAAAQDLSILNGGEINVSTFGPGNAGSLEIMAKDILINDQDSLLPTGLYGYVWVLAEGQGGDVSVTADRSLKILDGGEINVSTFGKGDAGSLLINTLDMTIDNQGDEDGTGIFGYVYSNAEGRGGDITIAAREKMEIVNGAVINASTFGRGDAGNLDIECMNLYIDSKGAPNLAGIFAQVVAGGDGRGGDLDIRVSQDLKMHNGGHINVSTFGNGSTGNLNVAAQNILIDGWSNPEGTGFYAQVDASATGHGGDITIEATQDLSILNGGEINVSTFGPGNAGSLGIIAKDILIDNQDSPLSTGFFGYVQALAQGKGGDVTVTADRSLVILDGGTINVSTFGEGDAGSLLINARDMIIDNQGDEDGTGVYAYVYSDARGRGGDVRIDTKDTVNILNGGQVNVSTFGIGDTGDLGIAAENVVIDGQGVQTGIFAQVGETSSGQGGDIHIQTGGSLSIVDQGEISISTFGGGNAGNLEVTARNIIIDALDGFWAGISGEAALGSSGRGGGIDITAIDTLTLQNGGLISLLTQGQGDAGNLDLRTGNLLIDGKGDFAGISAEVETQATGNGGRVSIDVENTLELYSGGQISVSTHGIGNAGSFDLSSKDIIIDSYGNDNYTGIAGQVASGAQGNGGMLEINVEDSLTLFDEGQINVSNFGQGDAGQMNITAGSIYIDPLGGDFTGLAAGVEFEASGNGGDMFITTRDSMTLVDGALVTSSSYGTGIAGDIIINSPTISLNNGCGIQSETLEADGGNIIIYSRDLFNLKDSWVTTSVSSSRGDGGNVTIDPVFIILRNSQVIANAYEGSGGNINLRADYFFFDDTSVVEASSELGIDGTVQIDTPNIDLSASFALLPEYSIIPELTGTSCEYRSNSAASSLIKTGWGGLPHGPDKPMNETLTWVFGDDLLQPVPDQ